MKSDTLMVDRLNILIMKCIRILENMFWDKIMFP